MIDIHAAGAPLTLLEERKPEERRFILSHLLTSFGRQLIQHLLLKAPDHNSAGQEPVQLLMITASWNLNECKAHPIGLPYFFRQGFSDQVIDFYNF